VFNHGAMQNLNRFSHTTSAILDFYGNPSIKFLQNFSNSVTHLPYAA
jgi:hypothetical protein